MFMMMAMMMAMMFWHVFENILLNTFAFSNSVFFFSRGISWP